MTAEQTIAEPEASSHVKTYGDKGAPEGMYSEFLGENASYFAQAFAPLNEVFSNAGPMKIVSDEADYTVVVSVRLIEDDQPGEGEVEVDCAILEAEQGSLQSCLTALD